VQRGPRSAGVATKNSLDVHYSTLSSFFLGAQLWHKRRSLAIFSGHGSQQLTVSTRQKPNT